MFQFTGHDTQDEVYWLTRTRNIFSVQRYVCQSGSCPGLHARTSLAWLGRRTSQQDLQADARLFLLSWCEWPQMETVRSRSSRTFCCLAHSKNFLENVLRMTQNNFYSEKLLCVPFDSDAHLRRGKWVTLMNKDLCPSRDVSVSVRQIPHLVITKMSFQSEGWHEIALL